MKPEATEENWGPRYHCCTGMPFSSDISWQPLHTAPRIGHVALGNVSIKTMAISVKTEP